MVKTIDIPTWKRKEHFEHFSRFDSPYFGIIAEVDCTAAYHTAKRNGYSFFLYYLYSSICAVNQIEEFRYRIIDDTVVLFDTIHVKTTIGRADETFAFTFIEYTPDFHIFSDAARNAIATVHNSTGIGLTADTKRPDIVHYTSVPWLKFTSLTHASHSQSRDSAPKISFGKVCNSGAKKHMPVSIYAHHALIDGLHIGKYVELFQKKLNG